MTELTKISWMLLFKHYKGRLEGDYFNKKI